MNRNVEIKARVEDLAGVEARARAISQGGRTVILQEDTFFRCPKGRLKLRRFSEDAGEIIFYERQDTVDPVESRYMIVPVPAPDSHVALLSAALGVKGVVRKRRTVYLVGQTRVHLDEVEGLGSFVELEVVLAPGETTDDGVRTCLALMAKLGIAEKNLVAEAYIDLLP